MPVKTSLLKTLSRRILIVSGLIILSGLTVGCDLSRNHLKMDRAGNMEFQDYRDALAPRIPEATDQMASMDSDNIPSLQSYVAQPSENLKPMPLVSISVNQTVPLRDVLFELSEQANYDLELDPRIRGSIIFTARDRPFDLVIKRISEIAGLRYKFKDDVLRVELDTPYHETYKIDYLSYIRKNTSSVENSVTVTGSSSGGNAAGGTGGSKFQASSESEADFWGELNANLTQILGASAASGEMRTSADPQITAVEQNPPPPPVDPVVIEGAEGETTVQVQPPQAVLQVSSLPTDAAADASQAQAQSASAAPPFSLNKQAGMISVFATERQHEKVREYLKDLKRSVTSQVLIEAKVLEVGLTDEFATGINWGVIESMIGDRVTFNLTGFGRPNFTPPLDPANPSNIAIGYASGDLNAVVSAVSRFGTVKALSSPRLTVLNNQSAVLNVARNEVFFELDVTTTSDENGVRTEVDSTIRSVPEGLLINVQPAIDLDNRSVSMALRPTVTRIVDQIPDPAVAFAAASVPAAAGIVSNIPVVNVQEMDSVVKMGSGQTIIMGGLMQDRVDSSREGVPILSEVPLIGAAFRNQGDRIQKTELIVFLRATIVDGDGNIDNSDRDLYKRFSGDRHPLKL